MSDLGHLSQQNVVSFPLENVPEPEKEKSPEPARNVTVRVEHPDITEDGGEDPTEEIEQIFRGEIYLCT